MFSLLDAHLLGTRHAWCGGPLALVCPQNFSEGTASLCSAETWCLAGRWHSLICWGSHPCLASSASPSPPSSPAWSSVLQNPAPALYSPSLRLHCLPLPDQQPGHEATRSQGSLSPLPATHAAPPPPSPALHQHPETGTQRGM